MYIQDIKLNAVMTCLNVTEGAQILLLLKSKTFDLDGWLQTEINVFSPKNNNNNTCGVHLLSNGDGLPLARCCII